MMRAIDILGLDFHPLDLEAAGAAIVARANRGGRFDYVATPNVDHIVQLHRHPHRRRLYDGAWMRLNDSKILSVLARAAGLALPTAPGSDLTVWLFDHAIDPAEPITVIGGDARLIAALQAQRGLRDVRWHAAPMGLRDKPDAIAAAADFAAAQRARFTFICVGAPQQEMVAAAIAMRAGAGGVGLCVGASLEFLTGRVRRAPGWMRRAGLEWLHRLLSEPRRLWRRYLWDGPAVFILWLEWLAARGALRSRRAAPAGGPG